MISSANYWKKNWILFLKIVDVTNFSIYWVFFIPQNLNTKC
jgi:hypothetical protein